jgi:thiol-disulfide isomerase/thioredoxin
MSRKGMIFALLPIVGLALAGCAPSSIEDDVAALNERVETLEKQIQTVQAGGGGAQLEQQARASLAAANQLMAMGKFDEAKAKLKTDMQKFAATKSGNGMQKLSRELAVIGKDCPSDWGIEKWFQGQDAVDLASGTTVVVFWETWCPHCRREVPKLQAMYDEYKGAGLQMVGLTRINKSSTEDAVKDLIAQNNVNYPIAKEDGSVAQYFNVSGIPAAAVVKDGKIVWRGHPAGIKPGMIKGWLKS